MLRLPAARPAALRCLRSAVPPCTALRSHRLASAIAVGLGFSSSGHPRPDSRWRRQGLPGSWGTPVRTCPALRPRRDLRARPLRRVGAAFRHLNDVGSHESVSFEAQSHGLARSLCTLRSARSPATPRNTRFRLLARLCRAGLATRWVPPEGFAAQGPPSPGFPGAPESQSTAALPTDSVNAFIPSGYSAVVNAGWRRGRQLSLYGSTLAETSASPSEARTHDL